VAAYAARLLARFDNTALQHRCAQIATDASLKLPQRIVAPLTELRSAGRPAPMLCFALAAWIRSCQGTDEAGRPMPLSDPQLQGWADLPGPEVPVDRTVQAFAAFAPVFGRGPDPAVMAGIGAALADIRASGMIEAARRRLAAPA
jgi:fructuronate reductase